MQTQSTHAESQRSYTDLAGFAALGGAALLLLAGWRRTSGARVGLSLAAAVLAYRAFGGRWPTIDGAQQSAGDTKARLSGSGGVHVHESIRLDRPVDAIYAFWRRLENLPRFMSHLDRVTPLDGPRSHWVARGPGGLSVEWDAEIINDVPGKVIGWRSLPGSDVVVAGSVNFDSAGDDATDVTVHLQYDPPAGRAGAMVASLLGSVPAEMIRADLRQLEDLLAREPSVAPAPSTPPQQSF
jgi:uncharacterized membrane protein